MTFFDQRLGKLDELLAAGASFGKIEDWIEDQAIDDESKAARLAGGLVRATARASVAKWSRPGDTCPDSPRHTRRSQPGPACGLRAVRTEAPRRGPTARVAIACSGSRLRRT